MNTSTNILVVDDDSKHCELMQDFLPTLHNVEVDVSPYLNDAIKLIKSRKDPYTIIWSDFNFKISRMNGLDFLGVVSKISPLSSRLLCAAYFPENLMIDCVISGVIQTYIIKPLSAEPTTSAIKIGIEYHKLNVLEKFIDGFELKSTDELEETIMKLHVIEERVGLKDEGFKIDFENRKEELNQLFLKNDVVIKKFSDKFSKPLEIYEGTNLKSDNEKTLKLMEQVKFHLESMKDHLLKNKIMIGEKIMRVSPHELQSNKIEFYKIQIKKKYGLE